MATEHTSSQNWLKLGEAAFALGVSEITLRRKIKAGRIPYELRDGKYFVLVDETSNESLASTTRPAPQTLAPAHLATPTLARQRIAPTPQRPTTNESKTSSHLQRNHVADEASEHFSHSLMATTMERARLQARIDELEIIVQQQNETIIDLRRQFEDQQTLIAFLEDRVRQVGH